MYVGENVMIEGVDPVCEWIQKRVFLDAHLVILFCLEGIPIQRRN